MVNDGDGWVEVVDVVMAMGWWWRRMAHGLSRVIGADPNKLTNDGLVPVLRCEVKRRLGMSRQKG